MVVSEEEICRLLDDWFDQNRLPVKDEERQELILTSRNGRSNRSYIREAVYIEPRFCHNADWPKGRDPNDCEGGSSGGLFAVVQMVPPPGCFRLTHSRYRVVHQTSTVGADYLGCPWIRLLAQIERFVDVIPIPLFGFTLSRSIHR